MVSISGIVFTQSYVTLPTWNHSRNDSKLFHLIVHADYCMAPLEVTYSRALQTRS